MFNSALLEFVIALVPIPVIGYAAYWAINIRRALGVPLYRNQALGVFLVAMSSIGYIFFFAIYNDLGLQSNLEITFEVFFSFGLPPLVAFYWIDASIRTARRSDPLLRQVFNWERRRRVFWVWVIAAFCTLVGSIVPVSHGVPPNTGPPPLPIFLFILSPMFLVAILGLVLLPRAAKFAGDKRFGRHLLWFGLFIFFVLFSLINIFIPFLYTPTTPALVPVLSFAIPQVVGGYCLYRSVRWLVPLNRITPNDETPK
jgi:hypothetical protein